MFSISIETFVKKYKFLYTGVEGPNFLKIMIIEIEIPNCHLTYINSISQVPSFWILAAKIIQFIVEMCYTSVQSPFRRLRSFNEEFENKN